MKASYPFEGLRRKHYRIFHVDCPWQFKSWSEKGEGRSAKQHYPVMDMDDLLRFPIDEIVAPGDSAMFFWVIQSMLPQAMDVLDRWGFELKTVAFYWIKMPKYWEPGFHVDFDPRMGMGYHTRAEAEQCWLATRGKGYRRIRKDIEQVYHEVIHSPLRQHSRKPDEIARRIVALTGDLPRVELFSRTPRPNWEVWGNDVRRFSAT